MIPVLDVMGSVVKSDSDSPDGFWDALRSAVDPLENVPDHFKDWHPGSNGQVLDLVHPSLFPLEYGKSRVVPYETVPKDDCMAYTGLGEQCPPLPSSLTECTANYTSPKTRLRLQPYGNYQWLPTDVSFDEAAKARIEGYINNLHPKHHGSLYPILAQAVEKAVPLWNECLDSFEAKERLRIKINTCGYEDFERPEEIPEDKWPDLDFIQENEDNPDKLKLIQPTVTSDYVPILERQHPHGEPLNLLRDFPEGLQVIFKLANIHLTPEKSSYEGSNWHVEGALNEHICATALFYYDQENVEESYLEFRQQLDVEQMVGQIYPPALTAELDTICLCHYSNPSEQMSIPYQFEYLAAERLFGVTQDGPAITNLGRVLTRPHRSLAFPNVLQHRVPPFSLRDRNKPGHRKILALFLVDPNIRLLSTSNVPPQRPDWWAEEARKVEPFARLPEELFDMIVERVEDWPIGWDEACAVRERVMEERGGMSEGIRDKWNEVCIRIALYDGARADVQSRRLSSSASIEWWIMEQSWSREKLEISGSLAYSSRTRIYCPCRTEASRHCVLPTAQPDRRLTAC